jgi:signal transduction histidine kinase
MWAYSSRYQIAGISNTYLREIAAAVAGAFLFAVLLTFHRWRGRLKRLEEQRNELTLAVMLRTREIRREKETVERQKQQIEELLRKAQHSNRAKDEFLANISHEIRTPLHGVLGMTDLALHTDLTTEQREYLELAETSAQSLLALLNDVLDYSKIEAGALTLEYVPFSVRECVQAAVAGFPFAAKRKGLEFELDIGANVPEIIEADALRLRQVLVNLLSNALKFTERGFIRVGVEDTSGFLQFKIQDSGIGIARDKQDAIFEPFRQADGSTTRKYGGTGLGLSICLRLARQMGGDLTLESEEGRGSTFMLRVPLRPSGDKATEPSTTESAPLPHQLTR